MRDSKRVIVTHFHISNDVSKERVEQNGIMQLIPEEYEQHEHASLLSDMG